MADSRLKDALVAVCEFTGWYNQQPAVRTGTDTANILRQLLHKVRFELSRVLEDAGLDSRFIKLGTGNGYVPRVPWVFVAKRSGAVSMTPGVAICFGREGNGLVLGAMLPIWDATPTVDRREWRELPDFINVDGVSGPTRYNRRFIDPTDCHVNQIDESLIVKVVKNGLEKL